MVSTAVPAFAREFQTGFSVSSGIVTYLGGEFLLLTEPVQRSQRPRTLNSPSSYHLSYSLNSYYPP